MHIFTEGTTIWVAQAANPRSGAVAYVGDATVIAIIPCSACYTDLRVAHAAASTRRIAPSEIALVGSVCRRPVGFFARTDSGDTIPVILTGHDGVIAVPTTAEEPVA